jgi:hypothetical protein
LQFLRQGMDEPVALAESLRAMTEAIG